MSEQMSYLRALLATNDLSEENLLEALRAVLKILEAHERRLDSLGGPWHYFASEGVMSKRESE